MQSDKCPGCSSNVSEMATLCPRCGKNLKNSGGSGIGLGLILVLLIAIGGSYFMLSGPSDKDKNKTQKKDKKAKKPVHRGGGGAGIPMGANPASVNPEADKDIQNHLNNSLDKRR